MDNTPVYIKKIIALIVVFIAGFFLKNVLPYYFVIPFCLFTLAFLIARITGEKPYYLYGMGEAQKYLDKKGGFWLLFKWIFGIFGLVYDVVAMILNGVYLLFTIFADILLLIKTILYWMVHAIIWFLKLFVPPLVYIYKIVLHYFIKWPWWIYKLTYRNANLSINRNVLRVSLPGAVLSLLIFFIFWGVGVITGIHAFILPGIVFALVPLAWSFGAISFIRHNNLSEEPFNSARVSFNGGFDAVRSLLVYLSLILVFLLTEVILNLLGWIPSIGFSLLGVSLNVNTLLTVSLLFLGVILLFANIILPPHIVTKNDFIPGPNESLQFLGIIGRKFLRYLAAFIPASFFSFFLLLIPALIISLSVFITLALRDNILDARIEMLKEKEFFSSMEERAEVKKNIKLLQFYKTFPQKTITEFGGIKELSIRNKNLNENLEKANEDLQRMEAEFTLSTDSLRTLIKTLTPYASDTIIKPQINRIETILKSKSSNFDSWKSLKLVLISEIKADLNYTRTLIYQLPVVFILTALWASLFGGIILTVLISYLGNVFYELYSFREDGRITFFTQTARNISKKNTNQPLLGFTLLFIVLVVLIFIFFFQDKIRIF